VFVRGATKERVLTGLLVLVGAGASFALTVVLFGFMVIAGLLLGLAGLALLCLTRTRHPAAGLLVAAAVVLSGPLVYATLAFL